MFAHSLDLLAECCSAVNTRLANHTRSLEHFMQAIAQCHQLPLFLKSSKANAQAVLESCGTLTAALPWRPAALPSAHDYPRSGDQDSRHLCYAPGKIPVTWPSYMRYMLEESCVCICHL